MVFISFSMISTTLSFYTSVIGWVMYGVVSLSSSSFLQQFKVQFTSNILASYYYRWYEWTMSRLVENNFEECVNNFLQNKQHLEWFSPESIYYHPSELKRVFESLKKLSSVVTFNFPRESYDMKLIFGACVSIWFVEWENEFVWLSLDYQWIRIETTRRIIRKWRLPKRLHFSYQDEECCCCEDMQARQLFLK